MNFLPAHTIQIELCTENPFFSMLVLLTFNVQIQLFIRFGEKRQYYVFRDLKLPTSHRSIGYLFIAFFETNQKLDIQLNCEYQPNCVKIIKLT